MQVIVKLIAVAILPFTGAALAQTSESAGGTKAEQDNDPDRVICVRERDTKSRLGSRRVCRTQAEWEEYRTRMQDARERTRQGY